MKSTLILLLGNRDIQIEAKDIEMIISKYSKFFTPNNDNADYYIVDKFNANKHDVSFWDISKMIFETADFPLDKLRYPLIDETLSILGKRDVTPDKIVITTSKQEPFNKQDSYYFALIVERYLLGLGFEVTVNPCSKNPTSFEDMFEYYNGLFTQEAEKCDRIFISNTGGTPQMRTASHFAGLFKGFEYIAINATDKESTKIYKQQEGQILREIIQKMVASYDYEGISKLPVSEEIKEYCQYALNLYNFSIVLAANESDYAAKAKSAIPNLFWNMVICFRQGRYADVIGRIFRLEESIGQYLLFQNLEKQGAVSENGEVAVQGMQDMAYESFLGNRKAQLSLYTSRFPDLFTTKTFGKNERVYFASHQSVPFECGKSFWYFFFKSKGEHQETTRFFAKINNNYNRNPLGDLRNNSILGHGFQGVTKADLENIIGDFGVFMEKLNGIIESVLSYNPENPFDPINESILAEL